MINEAPIITLPQITDAPQIKLTCNLTAKRILRSTKQLHHWVTCKNTPGIILSPGVIEPIPQIPVPTVRAFRKISKLSRVPFNRSTLFVAPLVPHSRTWGTKPTHTQSECNQISTHTFVLIITRHAINLLTLQEQAAFNAITIPTKLLKHIKSL